MVDVTQLGRALKQYQIPEQDTRERCLLMTIMEQWDCFSDSDGVSLEDIIRIQERAPAILNDIADFAPFVERLEEELRLVHFPRYKRRLL